MSLNTRSISMAVAGAAAGFMASAASATIIAGWTIPVAFPTGTGNIPTGQSYSPPALDGAPAGTANMGVQTAGAVLSGFHSNPSSQWTSPAGNGPQNFWGAGGGDGQSRSFSSTFWSIGDYYEIRASTAGFSNVYLHWEQTRSSTGPSGFELLMSTDGGTSFSTLMSYTVAVSGGGNATWGGTNYLGQYAFDLAIAGADNQSQLVFRFRATTGASATNGTNRIDNIFISSGAIPAPGALALLGVAGLTGAARRRR
jgi:hypothetical protein